MELIVVGFFFLVNLLLIYALSYPKLILEKSFIRNILIILTFAYLLISFVSLLFFDGSQTSLFFISVPLFVCLFLRESLVKIFGLHNDKYFIKVWLTAFCLFLIEEFLFSLGLKENLITHQVNFLVFYLVLSLIASLLVIKTKLSAVNLFLIGGVFGIVVEQQFLFFKLISQGNLQQIIFFAVYIFPVYGLYFATPKFIFLNRIKN